VSDDCAANGADSGCPRTLIAVGVAADRIQCVLTYNIDIERLEFRRTKTGLGQRIDCRFPAGAIAESSANDLRHRAFHLPAPNPNGERVFCASVRLFAPLAAILQDLLCGALSSRRGAGLLCRGSLSSDAPA